MSIGYISGYWISDAVIKSADIYPSEAHLIECGEYGNFTMRGITFRGINTANIGETAEIVRSALCRKSSI